MTRAWRSPLPHCRIAPVGGGLQPWTLQKAAIAQASSAH